MAGLITMGDCREPHPRMGEVDGAAAGSGNLPQPIVEISDKDYRSFCWPCHALEEADDCNTGH